MAEDVEMDLGPATTSDISVVASDPMDVDGQVRPNLRRAVPLGRRKRNRPERGSGPEPIPKRPKPNAQPEGVESGVANEEEKGQAAERVPGFSRGPVPGREPARFLDINTQRTTVRGEFTEKDLYNFIQEPTAYNSVESKDYRISSQKLQLFALEFRKLLETAGKRKLFDDTVQYRVEKGHRVFPTDHTNRFANAAEHNLLEVFFDYERLVTGFIGDRNPVRSLSKEAVVGDWLPMAQFLADHLLPWFSGWTVEANVDPATLSKAISGESSANMNEWLVRAGTHLKTLLSQVKGWTEQYILMSDFELQQAELARRWQILANDEEDPQGSVAEGRFKLGAEDSQNANRTTLIKTLLAPVYPRETASNDDAQPALLSAYYLAEVCSYVWDALHFNLTFCLNAYLDSVFDIEGNSGPAAFAGRLRWLADHTAELVVPNVGWLASYEANLGYCVYDEKFRTTYLPARGLSYLTLIPTRRLMNTSIAAYTSENLMELEAYGFLDALGLSNEATKAGESWLHLAGSRLLGRMLQSFYKMPAEHYFTSISTLFQMRLSFVEGCLWSISETPGGAAVNSLLPDEELLPGAVTFAPKADLLFLEQAHEDRFVVSVVPESQKRDEAMETTAGHLKTTGPLSERREKTPEERVEAFQEELRKASNPYYLESSVQDTIESEEKADLDTANDYNSWIKFEPLPGAALVADAKPNAFTLLSSARVRKLMDDIQNSELDGVVSPDDSDLKPLLDALNGVFIARKNVARGISGGNLNGLPVTDYTMPLYFTLMAQRAIGIVIRLLNFYIKHRNDRLSAADEDDAHSTKTVELLNQFLAILERAKRESLDALADDQASAGLIQLIETNEHDEITNALYESLRRKDWNHDARGATQGTSPAAEFGLGGLRFDQLLAQTQETMNLEESGSHVATDMIRAMRNAYAHAKYFQAHLYLLLEASLIAMHFLPAVARTSFTPDTLGADQVEGNQMVRLRAHLFSQLNTTAEVDLVSMFRAPHSTLFGFIGRPANAPNPAAPNQQSYTDSFYVQRMKTLDFKTDDAVAGDAEKQRRNALRAALESEAAEIKIQAQATREQFADACSNCLDILSTLLHPGFEVVSQHLEELRQFTELKGTIDAAQAKVAGATTAAAAENITQTAEKRYQQRLETFKTRRIFRLTVDSAFYLSYKIKEVNSQVWDPTLRSPVTLDDMAEIYVPSGNGDATLTDSASVPRLSWVYGVTQLLYASYRSRIAVTSYLMYHLVRGKTRFVNGSIARTDTREADHKTKLWRSIKTAAGWLFVRPEPNPNKSTWSELSLPRAILHGLIGFFTYHSMTATMSYYLNETPTETGTAFIMNLVACLPGSPVKWTDAASVLIENSTENSRAWINNRPNKLSNRDLGSDVPKQVLAISDSKVMKRISDFVAANEGLRLNGPRSERGQTNAYTRVTSDGRVLIDLEAAKNELPHAWNTMAAGYRNFLSFRVVPTAGLLGLSVVTGFVADTVESVGYAWWLVQTVIRFATGNQGATHWRYREKLSLEGARELAESNRTRLAGWHELVKDTWSLICGKTNFDERGYHNTPKSFKRRAAIYQQQSIIALASSSIALLATSAFVAFNGHQAFIDTIQRIYEGIQTSIAATWPWAVSLAALGTFLMVKGSLPQQQQQPAPSALSLLFSGTSIPTLLINAIFSFTAVGTGFFGVPGVVLSTLGTLFGFMFSGYDYVEGDPVKGSTLYWAIDSIAVLLGAKKPGNAPPTPPANAQDKTPSSIGLSLEVLKATASLLIGKLIDVVLAAGEFWIDYYLRRQRRSSSVAQGLLWLRRGMAFIRHASRLQMNLKSLYSWLGIFYILVGEIPYLGPIFMVLVAIVGALLLRLTLESYPGLIREIDERIKRLIGNSEWRAVGAALAIGAIAPMATVVVPAVGAVISADYSTIAVALGNAVV